MKNTPHMPTVILGSGPVALACALVRARHGPLHLVLQQSGRRSPPMPRVEVVPSVTLALLVELGVHPHRIGVRGLTRQRLVAWAGADPVGLASAEAAHLERPALDHALLELVLQERAIKLYRASAAGAASAAKQLAGDGSTIIDATGRNSVMSRAVRRPARPWVARLFHVHPGAARMRAGFCLAALPDGYLYRAASANAITVGVVGRGALVGGNGELMFQRLARGPGAWVIDDLTPRDWMPVGAGPASIQWSCGSNGLPIGDAALARDALASQGLANGLSDGCNAALVTSTAEAAAIRARSSSALASHLRSLVAVIEDCRWRAQPAWADYLAFLRAAPGGAPNQGDARKPAQRHAG